MRRTLNGSTLRGLGASAGLKIGDIITQVNESEISSVSDFISKLQSAASDLPLVLRVVSKGKKVRTLKINPKNTGPIDV